MFTYELRVSKFGELISVKSHKVSDAVTPSVSSMLEGGSLRVFSTHEDFTSALKQAHEHSRSYYDYHVDDSRTEMQNYITILTLDKLIQSSDPVVYVDVDFLRHLRSVVAGSIPPKFGVVGTNESGESCSADQL